MNQPLLLITRPAEEAGRTAAAAQAAGFATLCAPLLVVEPLAWDQPEAMPQALLFTSARSPQLVASACPALRAVPAYAVGARTAQAAREAGFRLQAIGAGDGSEALAMAAGDGVRHILHLAGEARAPLDVPARLVVERRAVYAARRAEALGDDALLALRNGTLFAALLFSARTSRHFSRLLERAAIGRHSVRIIALSDAVAEAAGQGWRAVGVAAKPSLAEALASARCLWQGAEDG